MKGASEHLAGELGTAIMVNPVQLSHACWAGVSPERVRWYLKHLARRELRYKREDTPWRFRNRILKKCLQCRILVFKDVIYIYHICHLPLI